MVKLTMIARVLDGLPLAEGLDTDASLDLEYYKQQAKTLFKKLGQNSSSSHSVGRRRRTAVEDVVRIRRVLHALRDRKRGVLFDLVRENYPKKLAYSYLEGESKQNSFLFFSRIRFD